MTGSAVVVGAGVLGCSITLSLARRGWDVVCVDREPAAGRGSTSASAAIVRFHYSTRVGTAMAWEAKHRWERWGEHLGLSDGQLLASYHRTGMLVLDTPDLSSRRALPHFDAIGIPYEVLDADQLRQRFPAVTASRFWPPRPPDDPTFWQEPGDELGAFLSPEGGFVDDPVLATDNLRAAAEAAGATFRFGAQVVGFDVADERVRGVLLANGERLPASVVVNVGGPHSGRINALTGVERDMQIRTRPLRQEVCLVPSPEGFGLTQGSPFVSDADLGIYFGPQPGGQLLVGGLEPECDPLEWVEDPDQYNPSRTTAGWELLTSRLARRLPELRVPHQPRGSAGLYDATPDWLPVYDRTCLDGFFVAIGSSGNQFKNAPVVGDLMAALVERVQDGHDHDSTPVHVTLPETGIEVDLGTFSRLRAPAMTSGSVLG